MRILKKFKGTTTTLTYSKRNIFSAPMGEGNGTQSLPQTVEGGRWLSPGWGALWKDGMIRS